tara:strand:- start:34365 stop:34550 length:186 start_codon:yes stop_codon:yes gene_type:complete
MKAYVDLEGKIPAKHGDRVALVIFEDSEYPLIQEEVSKRPIYRDHPYPCVELNTPQEGMEQ